MRPISLPELPTEILEYALMFLPPRDILRMKKVSRFFRRFVSSSHCLQHRIDLFGVGLVDNHRVVCGLAQRRAQLRAYVNRWENPEASVRYGCSLKNLSCLTRLYPAGQDLLSAREADGSPKVCFARIPSSPSQGTAKEWTLEFHFNCWNYQVYSQENLLAIIEGATGVINIHLLDLMDGSPHKIPLKKVLQLSLVNCPALLPNAHIGGSRIALVVGFLGPDGRRGGRKLIVWDWRTGEVVLEYSSQDSGIGYGIFGISAIHFIGESWLVALSDHGSDPLLLVFDTLLPQPGPRDWRMLELPRLPPHKFYVVPSRQGNPPEERPEFLVDPAQKNFVVQAHRGAALVIPVELFISVMHPSRAYSCIPWSDWGRFVIKLYLHPETVTVQLVDMKVLVLRNSSPSPEGWRVEVYDLSKSGRKDIQAQNADEERDKEFRRLIYGPRWFSRLQMGAATSTFLVGSKVVCLSSESSLSDEEHNLRIWKIA